MELNIHFVSKKLVEVSVDEITTGVLDAEEAKQLAQHLMYVAAELLEANHE